MKRRGVMPYFVIWVVAASLLFLSAAHPPNPSENACLEITDVSSKSEEKERAYATYTQCRLKRPHAGGSLMGVDDAAQECREFARMYMMARHYNSKLSNQEFCSTMRSYSGTSFATDSRIMDHGACVAGVAQILASKEVGEAAEEACQHIHPKEADMAAACQKYVVALEAAPRDGFVDSGRICDKMLTGSNGTRSLDEEHFVYSCVQYASNVIDESPHDTKSDQSEKAALDVQASCEAHLSSDEKGFCSGYANLVRKRASRKELNQYCDAQYRKMHKAKAANASSTNVTSDEAVHAPSAKAEEAAPSAAPVEKASPQKAEEKPAQKTAAQNFKIAHAHAASVPTKMVVAAPQPKPQLPLAPKPIAVPVAASQAKPKMKAPDMMAMCKETIAKVSGIGLTGSVFEGATAEVCMNNLLAAATKQPKLRVQRGCRFFAKHLVDAQSRGPVDAAHFCAELSKPAAAHPVSVPTAHLSGSAPAKPKEVVPAVVVPEPKPVIPLTPAAPLHLVAKPKLRTAASQEAKEPVVPLEEREKHHVQKAAIKKNEKQQSHVKAEQVVAAPAKEDKPTVDIVVEGEKSDEDFLNGFLDKFDATEATAKQKHVDEVQNKVKQLFGDDPAMLQQTKPAVASEPTTTLPSAKVQPAAVVSVTEAPAPSAQPAHVTALVTVAQKDGAENAQKAASDDFLSSFLDNYDDKTAAPKEAAPTVATAVGTTLAPASSVAAPEVDPALSTTTAAPAASSGDIDSLVSSFLDTKAS